jgi:hypothetical protein
MDAEYLAPGQTSRAQHGVPLPPAASQARALLQRLANTWGRRARVKQPEREGETLFDASKDDFLPALLPFREHSAFLAAPDAMRQQILSCGWLAYNEKTVDIEAQIVAPACRHILAGDVPGLHDGVSKQIAGQTLVDEAYHELLVLHACQVTRETGLGSHAPARVAAHCQDAPRAGPVQRSVATDLVHLTTAIVSEVFISDYLHVLSQEMTIQPFNRLTVAAHRHDQLAHGSIFKGSPSACMAVSLGTNAHSSSRCCPSPCIGLRIWS